MSKYLDDSGLSYFWEKLKTLFAGKADGNDTGTAFLSEAIPFGVVDSTSTATVIKATVEGITQLVDGTTVILKNGVVTSATNWTLNINELGAKPVYTSLAAATRETSIFNVNYTMMFVYDSTRVEGGGWICYRGSDANTNTIGYQLRTNSSTLPTTDKFYRYRLLFTSADGTHWIPSNTSSSTNATAARAVNQRPIDPFGEIVYYGTTAAVEANANPSAASLWQQYTLTLGYAFNRTGAALVLPYPKPIYIKCAPQTDGSAIIDADTPYVTALPSSKDGKIYILLGRTYSATAIELIMTHPVYYHDGTGIRLWTGAEASGLTGVVINTSAEPYDLPITNGNAKLDIGDGLSASDASNKVTLEHATGAGWKHIPSGGSAGQFLGYSSSGTASWQTPPTPTVPTKTSDLTNDSGFVNSTQAASAAPVQSVNGQTGAVSLTIPTVPTNVSSFTNDAGYLTLSTLPIYDGTVTTP